jgi:hypothetical protein
MGQYLDLYLHLKQLVIIRKVSYLKYEKIGLQFLRSKKIRLNLLTLFKININTTVSASQVVLFLGDFRPKPYYVYLYSVSSMRPKSPFHPHLLDNPENLRRIEQIMKLISVKLPQLSVTFSFLQHIQSAAPWRQQYKRNKLRRCFSKMQTF